MKKTLSINNQIVQAGEKAIVNLNIARLASGTQIDLPIYVYRSLNPGPVVLLSGGLHGDEVDGIEIVRRLVEQKVFDKLQRGTVIAIPIMNIYGFLNFSREVPDGKDINRSFPGNNTGSLAARVAHYLTHTVLKEIDFGIDFHTGGANRYNFPQTRFAPNDLKAREIARVFNAPISLESKLIDKSIRKEAFKMGKSIVVFEGGESMRFDQEVIEQGIIGAKKVLNHFEMIDYNRKSIETVHCDNSLWVRAKNSGLFHSMVKSGEKVKNKEIIGKIVDPFGKFLTKIKAPKDGIIIGHSNAPVINQGDALFHLGMIS